MKRRRFIKSVSVAGAAVVGTSLVQCEPGTKQDKTITPSGGKKVIVAGGGIGGLCCAYELMKMGHEVTLLEASDRVGGHVMSSGEGLADGLYADYGAEHITKPGYDEFWEYTREFDLEVLPYPRRVDELRQIEGKFYSEEMLADPSILKSMGFNEREVRYLAENPWWDLASLFMEPYLHKFTNEYQPFGVGYDQWDIKPMSEIYQQQGASATALKFLGGNSTSALYNLWQAGILKLRGVPLYPPEVFRIKGGNQGLTDAFALRLEGIINLNSPIISINHGESGVTVRYTQHGEEKQMFADYLANCIPLPTFRKIPVQPAFSPEKQYVLDHLTYGTYARVIFQAENAFWKEDKLSINMQFEHPDIWSVWQVAEEVNSEQVALMGTGPGGITPDRALTAFKEAYPGKSFTVKHALIKDWPRDSFAPTCERAAFPMNTLSKFWPRLMEPEGKIHFAGSYADNLNWGMEAATRSANRVALEIDQA